MNKLVVSNLVHRPVRSLISVVAIAVEVTLILLVVGLLIGILEDSKERAAGIGFDVIVQPPGSSFLSAISGAPTPIKVAGKLSAQPHVAVVAPVVIQGSIAGSVEVITGIDLKTYEALGGPFHYLAGGPFQAPDDILVDDIWANDHPVRIGDHIEVLNHSVRVAGIVEHGRGGRKYLPLSTLQDWIGAQDKASLFYVKADDPENADLIVEEFGKIPGMEKFVMRTKKDYLSMLTTDNLPMMSTTINVVVGVAVIIGFIVIFQAMYTAVMERTREIGILKSLGASRFYIINVVLRETVLLALVGIGLGIVASYAVRAGITARFRLIPILITQSWILKASTVALVGAILGALYPAFKAAQKDAVDALAYE